MPALMDFTINDLARFLNRKAAGLSDMDLSKPLRKIERLIAQHTDACFVGQRTPDGVPWEPRKDGTGKKLLKGKGVLRKSVTRLGDENHIGGVTRNSLSFGSKLEVAGVHNLGATVLVPARQRGPGEKPYVFTLPNGATVFTMKTKAHEVKIPARRFLDWSDALLEEADEIMLDYLEEKLWE